MEWTLRIWDWDPELEQFYDWERFESAKSINAQFLLKNWDFQIPYYWNIHLNIMGVQL